MQASRKGGVLVSLRGDNKVYEYKGGEEDGSTWVDGDKKVQ